MQDLINVLIVENEREARDTILSYCEEHPRMKVLGVASNGSQFIEQMSKNPDLVILDVELEDIRGTSALRELENAPPVIISTAHPEYAVEAFELGVVDFLVKPYSYQRFLKSVSRVMQITETLRAQGTLPSLGVSVRSGEIIVFLPFSDIVYVEARGKGSVIHTTNTEYYTPRLLLSIEERLPPARFLRIHKQFVVNLGLVSSMKHVASGDYIATLDDTEKSQIPVSRKHSPDLKNKMGLE